MDSDLSLSEQISLLGASVERNLVVIAVLIDFLIIIQGITILLFLLLIDGLVLSIVIGFLGVAIIILGFYSPIGNIQKSYNYVGDIDKSQEESSDSVED